MSILIQIARGDQKAVSHCVEKYGGLLWSIVRRYIHSQAEAEEMIQEIFTQVWQQASRYDPEKGKEAVFLATIARRRCIDRLRANSSRPRTENIDDLLSRIDAISVQPGQESETDSAMMLKQLDELDEVARRLILLNMLYGYSHREISEMTKTPLGTVKTHIRRGLQEMKTILTQKAKDVAGGVDDYRKSKI